MSLLRDYAHAAPFAIHCHRDNFKLAAVDGKRVAGEMKVVALMNDCEDFPTRLYNYNQQYPALAQLHGIRSALAAEVSLATLQAPAPVAKAPAFNPFASSMKKPTAKSSTAPSKPAQASVASMFSKSAAPVKAQSASVKAASTHIAS